MSHRRADAKRRKHHHVIRKLEHHLREALHRPNNELSFFANGRDGQRKKHRERDDLEDVSVHHGFDHAGGEHVHDRFDKCFRVTLSDRFDYICARWRESYTDARLCEIDNSQSNEERGCRYDLEID